MKMQATSRNMSAKIVADYEMVLRGYSRMEEFFKEHFVYINICSKEILNNCQCVTSDLMCVVSEIAYNNAKKQLRTLYNIDRKVLFKESAIQE